MNVHKSKSEWCSHTWNPVTGWRYAWPAGHALQGPYAAVQCAAVRGGTNTLPEAMDVSTALLGGVRRMSDRMDEEVAHASG